MSSVLITDFGVEYFTANEQRSVSLKTTKPLASKWENTDDRPKPQTQQEEERDEAVSTHWLCGVAATNTPKLSDLEQQKFLL